MHAWPRPCADPECGVELLGPRSVPYLQRHEGRGLCARCHRRHSAAGTLDLFPVRWRSEDLVTDAEIVRAREALTWAQVAERLGVSFAALDQARVRVRRRQRTGVAG
jgi:hypothetical protein